MSIAEKPLTDRELELLADFVAETAGVLEPVVRKLYEDPTQKRKFVLDLYALDKNPQIRAVVRLMRRMP